MFKMDPKQEGAKLDDPEIDKELVHLVMDKVDQVCFYKSPFRNGPLVMLGKVQLGVRYSKK